MSILEHHLPETENLAKTMRPVLHKELEYKVEKLKYKKLEVMHPRIKTTDRTSSWWMNHPGSVHTKFYSPWLINTLSHLLVKNDKGEEKGGGLINFLPLKKRGAY